MSITVQNYTQSKHLQKP